MKRLRYVVVPGNTVEAGECYLMAAIPTVVPPQPGEPQIIGQVKLNMNMVPCRLEWVTSTEDGEDISVDPIVLEDIAPPRLVVPK